MSHLKQRLLVKVSNAAGKLMTPPPEVDSGRNNEIEKMLDGLDIEDSARPEYRTILFEIKRQAPCEYQELQMMKELESNVAFEKRKKEMGLHLLITPELANDGVHQSLIKRIVSFNLVYQKHLENIKELEGRGIYEAHLTAEEKHRRLVVDRKKILND